MKEHFTKIRKFDLTQLPGDPLELKGKLYLSGIENKLDESLKYINEEYSHKELLYRCLKFVNWHMADGVKSTIDQLTSIGFYPIVEAGLELDWAFKHGLFGSYKAAFADIRRALELAVLSVYFVSNENHSLKAKEWIKSQTDTPFLSSMLRELIKTDRYSNINSQQNWEANLKRLYHCISDFGHNKGTEKSYNKLNAINFHTGGSHIANLNLETLSTFLDYYILTVREIAAILALYNPVLLVGLEMEEKFGFNSPFSGYYGEHQSKLLTSLLPEQYKGFFKDLKAKDEEVLDVKLWFESQPDISETEIEEQIRQHDEMLNSIIKKDKL